MKFNYLIQKLNKDEGWAFLFVARAFLGILIFILIPVVASFCISFCKWDLIDPIKFVGLNNYIEIFNDQIFYSVLSTTFIYSFFTAFFGVILPLFLAVLLNKNIKGTNLCKLAVFTPYVTPMIVCAIAWECLYDPNYSIINWVYDKNIALIALIIASVWKNIGYNMILFLAALQNIPESYSEVAKIDGANEISRFLTWFIL